MLHHLSIAVNNPLQVGNTLAEIFQGRCFPFPPHPGSYIVLVDDGQGTGIELYPAGTQLIPGLDEAGFSVGNALQTFTSVHVAVSVPISFEQIREIAHREGWLVRLCDRTAFHVIELWVENKFLIELLTPELAEVYVEFAQTTNWETFINQPSLPLVEV